MTNTCKKRVQPDLNHLVSLFDDTTMSAFLTGHLIIESLLVQMINLKEGKTTTNNPWNLNFPGKVERCKSTGLIDSKMGKYLCDINKIRNRYAHRLGYTLSFDEVFRLAKKAYNAGIDFSDTTMCLNRELSKQSYDTGDIIQEVFQNTAQDLSFIMADNGGQFQFA